MNWLIDWSIFNDMFDAILYLARLGFAFMEHLYLQFSGVSYDFCVHDYKISIILTWYK